jgi:hypothetical protein
MTMLVLLAVVVGACGAFAALGSRVLFDWYMRTVRRLDVPQDPAEAVITYPLA